MAGHTCGAETTADTLCNNPVAAKADRCHLHGGPAGGHGGGTASKTQTNEAAAAAAAAQPNPFGAADTDEAAVVTDGPGAARSRRRNLRAELLSTVKLLHGEPGLTQEQQVERLDAVISHLADATKIAAELRDHVATRDFDEVQDQKRAVQYARVTELATAALDSGKKVRVDTHDGEALLGTVTAVTAADSPGDATLTVTVDGDDGQSVKVRDVKWFEDDPFSTDDEYDDEYEEL